MTNYYKFARGLGKKEIGIVIVCCLGCRKAGVTLYAVDDRKGRKAYACGACKGSYRKWKK